MYSIGDIRHFGERINEERKDWSHIWSGQTRWNRGEGGGGGVGTQGHQNWGKVGGTRSPPNLSEIDAKTFFLISS